MFPHVGLDYIRMTSAFKIVVGNVCVDCCNSFRVYLVRPVDRECEPFC